MENRSVGNWNREFNVLFLDQPVGTGYSHAGSSEAYASNEEEVAQDLYFFLQSWLKEFPDLAEIPLVIAGESYGGHYIPAFAYKILQENEMSVNPRINLAGIAIGDGLTDPCSQVETGPRAAYDFGIIDAKTFAMSKAAAIKATAACAAQNYTAAHEFREEMESIVLDASGINPYDVRTFDNYDYMHGRMDSYLNLPDTKRTLNVPEEWPFATDAEVSKKLYDDVMKSQADKFPYLLERTRVLMYQGQFDWKDGPFSNEKWMASIQWSGKPGYLAAVRKRWLTPAADGSLELSGWVQRYGSLTEIVVNGAGHLAPMNQPLRLYDMIKRFVNNEEFLTA